MAKKTKSRRWTCPECEHALLAPERLEPNDTRRICLPCSSGSTRLVKRICKALEREREAKSERAASRREQQKQRKLEREAKAEKRRSQWDFVFDHKALVEARNKGGVALIHYLHKNARELIRSDFVGEVRECPDVQMYQLQHIWLINRLPEHPLRAVYLGAIDEGVPRPIQWERALRLQGRAATPCVWGRDLLESPPLGFHWLQHYRRKKRLSQEEGIAALREPFEAWFEENWGKLWARVEPKLLEDPVTRTEGFRDSREVSADFLIDPLPMIWRLPKPMLAVPDNTLKELTSSLPKNDLRR